MSHPSSSAAFHARSHPAPARHAVDPRLLWFGLFGAPAVWTIQELVGYILAAHACFPHMAPRATPALGGLWVLELGLGIAALIVAGLAGWMALRSWRAVRPRHPGAGTAQVDIGEGRARFMALAGILVSGMFLLGILMNVLPIFLVAPCS
jgi:hypothetical protein